MKELKNLIARLKADIRTTTVFFETEDEFYDFSFNKNIFGKITYISLIKGKRGEPKTLEGHKVIRILNTSPQNIMSRLKLICLTFEIFLKDVFLGQ